MTNQTPESVIAEVIEYHADAIGSHYDGCYKHHAVCLAVKLRDMLRESGVPDVVTAASVAPLAESVPTSKHISPRLPSMIRNLWKSDPSENSVRTALKLAGDLIQELIDLRAAEYREGSET